jgi:hypothetical protein
MTNLCMKMYFKKVKNSLIYRCRFLYFRITALFWSTVSMLIVSNARNTDVKKSLFVFVPVWGEEYINWFFIYMLPSLMQENNLPLVKEKKKIVFYFYTKEENIDYLNRLIKINIVDFESKIYTEANFCDHARDMMSNYFIHILKEGIDKKSLLLFAMPDSIFSNGSIDNMVNLSDGKGVSIAIASPRISIECIKNNNISTLCNGSELTDIVLKCQHQSLAFTNDFLDVNSTLEGISTKRVKNGILVTHNLPSVFLCDPIKSDLSFFRRRPLFNIIDKLWPHMLFRQSRLKVVASSDIALVVELTHDNDKKPKLSSNMKYNDFYKGFPPFVNYSNVSVGLWRNK